MRSGPDAIDPNSVLVVPDQPGDLLALGHTDGRRDEFDDLLDEMFGVPDSKGAGPVDAALIIGGLGAIFATLAAPLPVAIAICGAVALAIGSVLPIRSLGNRFGSRRRHRRIRVLLDQGALLRVDHPALHDLIAAHDRLVRASGSLASARRQQARRVAHESVREVSSLLYGTTPSTAAEVEYVATRVRALRDLAVAVEDPEVGDGDHERRQAMLEARYEVEQIAGGSALTAAADLERELREDYGS